MKKMFLTMAALAAFTWLGASAGAQTAAYFASGSGPYGGAANNSGLNIGQTFAVASTNIQVLSLGVYDYAGDGLKASHSVILFSNHTAIASVTVPAGTNAILANGFRFAPLTSPVNLLPGTYSVVAYQMNGTANNSDGYGDTSSATRNGFNGTFNLLHTQTIFEFSSSPSAYPGTGGGGLGTSAANLASASFTYKDSSTTTIAYTADPSSAQKGSAANNSGLNIGHNFTVTGSGIAVYQLGVFDYQGNGLASSHDVTLFTNQTALATVTVPAGTDAPLANGFRFAPLDTPLTLPAGNYSIIVYQMNGGSSSDPYCEGNVSGFTVGGNVTDTGYSPYTFDGNGTPEFPAGGALENFAVCSFTYSNVLSLPLVAAQSATNVTVFAGAAPILSVVAAGFPPVFTYQWYLNGSALIAGATNATYSPGKVTLADSGKKFVCTVANSGGITNTAPIKLTVVAAPAITYPATIIADHPLNYWRLNEGPDDGAGNNGVICNDYLGGDAGVYMNTVLGQAGFSAYDSDTAATFGSFASANSYVGNIFAVDFSTASDAAFSVEAWVNGTAGQGFTGILCKGVGLQEQFCLDTGGSGDAFRFYVRDAGGTAHLASGTGTMDGNWHHLVGVCDTVHSLVALYVDGNLSATGSITPHTGIKSSTEPMAIGARQSGAGTGYDWQFDGSIDEVAVYGTALSSTQVLNHYYAAGIAPSFPQPPANVTASEGGPATFNAIVVGTSPLSYQWYDVTAGTPGTLLNGATNSTLTLNGLTTSQNGNLYLVVVTNLFGTATSASAQLTVVTGPPVIQVDIPQQTVVYAGRNAAISVQAGGTLPLYYQWQFNGTPLTNGANVAGSQSSVLTLLNVQPGQAGEYQVAVTNLQGGPAYSSIGLLQVITVPSFNTNGAGWALNGSPSTATIDQNLLTLTDGNTSEAKSSYFSYPLYIGGFQASFTYQDTTVGGADGIAFVMQNSPAGTAAVGTTGGGLGYSGITPSAALLLNLYGTVGIGFGTDGNGTGSYSSTAPVDISNGDPIDVMVTYAQPLLNVTLTDETTLATFSTSYTVGSLPEILGTNTACVGFTGGDGLSTSVQTISNFAFTPIIPLAVQAAGSGTVSLAWPASAGGYSAQYRTDLSTGDWQDVTNAVTQVNGQNQIIISPAAQKSFYRLVLTAQ